MLRYFYFQRKLFERKCCFLQWNLDHEFSSSYKTKNHYETLNLSSNCSSKEVREAFITLSKQFHPDKNKSNPKAQEQFVKISEAYNVLIKPKSRREYDCSLQSYGGYASPHKHYGFGSPHEYYSGYRQERDPWKDPSFAMNQKFWKEESKNEDDYYMFKGVKKMTHDQLVRWIMLLAGVGLFIQVAIIRITRARDLAMYDKRSKENKRHLDSIRDRAESFGSRENQIEEYKRRTGFQGEE